MPLNSRVARVVYVNHSMGMGGIETMIRDFAFNIDRARFDPSVAVFRAGGQLIDQLAGAGIGVEHLDKREGLDIGLISRLRRHIVRTGARVVHSHNYSAWLYCVLASLGLPSVRIIHTEHSRVAPLWRRHVLERLLASRTHAVAAVSADVAESMVTEIRIPRSRVCMIANGINLGRFKPDERRRAAMRESLGLKSDEIVFGILARLVQVKSHRTLVDAFRIVCEELPNARLVVAGDGPCRAELELQVCSMGLEGKVLFLGEVSDGERVLNGLDVYMLSSLDEGMNLTLLEAMGASLPVVATEVGGNPEVVVRDQTGLLVPPAQPQAMAGAMLRFAREPDLRDRLGRAGRARVEAGFSQAATLDAYMNLYEGAAPEPWRGRT